MTHTPGPERSAIYELLRYGRKHDGPWTEAITGDQLIDEENADLFTASPDMLAALKLIVQLKHDELNKWLLSVNAKYPTLLGYAEAAIAKAEGR